MPKKIVYTKITPLAANVPRQLALDMLHSHGEIIELNPLVTGHKAIPAPRDASRDEYFAQWYEIEEIITWGFGMKKKIAFKGCFHDMPWGLQTHIYAPMGVDLRNKYQIAGNQPGEPKEVRELGIDAPAEGLYLKEDVEITCNIALASFVKKETKQTLLTMIERMTRKAELLDDGALLAMFENGRLRTVNPAQVATTEQLHRGSVAETVSDDVSPSSPPSIQQDFSPAQAFTKYSNLPGRMSTQYATAGSPLPYGVPELDSSPSVDANGVPPPAPNTVEMEGSNAFVPDDRNRYPYQNADAPAVFHAELADTSAAFAPRRLSNLSFTYSSRPNSTLAPSVHSRRSVESQQPTAGNASSPPRPQHISEQKRHSRTPIGNLDSEHPANRTNPPYPDGPNDYGKPSYQAFKQSQRSGDQSQLTSKVIGLAISGDGSAPTRFARCPMDKCDFQGDSTSVSLHVNRHHFN